MKKKKYYKTPHWYTLLVRAWVRIIKNVCMYNQLVDELWRHDAIAARIYLTHTNIYQTDTHTHQAHTNKYGCVCMNAFFCLPVFTRHTHRCYKAETLFFLIITKQQSFPITLKNNKKKILFINIEAKTIYSSGI